MTVEENSENAKRRQRIKRLKKVILITLAAAILIPVLLCIFLGVRVYKQSKEITELKNQLAAMTAGEESIQTNVFVSAKVEESARAKLQTGLIDTQDEKAAPGREIYLTFDDGPSSNTNKILDILKEYNIKATFFVIGREDEASIEAYRRIAAEGHTLGMHSYSHKYQEIYESADSFAADLTRLQEYLYDITGVWSRYVRFPGGSSNSVSKVGMQELIDYLSDMGITYYDWNVASGDAASGYISTSQIIHNCLQQLNATGTNIILMHDAADKNTTVAALPELIETIIEADPSTVFLPITDETEPVQHVK